MIQPILGGNFNGLATSGTNYGGLMGGEGWASDPKYFTQVFPIAGTLSNLRILLTAAPGVGKSHVFTVMINGSDTAMVITISDANTSGNYAGGISISAGDYVSIKHTSSGTPATAKTAMGVKFDSGVGGAVLVGNRGDSTDVTATEYSGVAGSGGGWGGTEGDHSQVCPVAGNLQNFRVRLDVAPGAGKSQTFTIMKNGSATAVTVTISDSATTGADTTHAVAVAAGDKISVRNTHSGSPAATPSGWGVELDPTIDGESPLCLIQSSGTGISTSSPNYGLPSGNFGDWTGSFNQTFSTTEANCRSIAPCDFTWKALYFEVNVAPGSGNSWIITLRPNGGDSSVTTSIANTATAATPDTSNSASVTDGQTVALNLTPISGPTAAGRVKIGSVAYVAPAGAAVALKRNSTLNGLGASGPFFHNPLG